MELPFVECIKCYWTEYIVREALMHPVWQALYDRSSTRPFSLLDFSSSELNLFTLLFQNCIIQIIYIKHFVHTRTHAHVHTRAHIKRERHTHRDTDRYRRCVFASSTRGDPFRVTRHYNPRTNCPLSALKRNGRHVLCLSKETCHHLHLHAERPSEL